MKKLLLFLFLTFVTLSVVAQSQVTYPEIKQITDFDFDIRNPEFARYPGNMIEMWNQGSKLFFEVHENGKSNIAYLTYNPLADKFENITYITSDTFNNRNPHAMQFFAGDNEKMYAVWETKRNGNWDLALSVYSGGSWSAPELLTNSPEDEINSSIVEDYFPAETLRIIFEKDHSIYIMSITGGVVNSEVVMKNHDDITFMSPTGTKTVWSGDNIYAAAVRDSARVKQKIVYRSRALDETIWSELTDASDYGSFHSPKFVDIWSGYSSLSYESYSNGINRIYYLYDITLSNDGEYAEPDTSLWVTDFSAFIFPIITNKERIGEGIPNTYKIIKGDSLFVKVNEGYGPGNYQSWRIPIKFNGSHCTIGPAALDYYFVSYYVWEDSSSGHINLFGVRRYDPIGKIESNANLNPESLLLFQNYPNPFNPTTSIRYAVGGRQFVSLKVYDVLGREAATLVNEKQSPGNYKVEFDASRLSSGVYFYRLQSGGFVKTKKMIILR